MTISRKQAQSKITQQFVDLQETAAQHSESYDCSVKALTLVMGKSYEEVQEFLISKGRRPGKIHTTTWADMWDALDHFGFDKTYIDPRKIIWNFPGKHKQKKYLTSHSPDRFPKAWPTGTYLMCTQDHVLPIIDGVNHDWSRGRSLRCRMLYKITKR